MRPLISDKAADGWAGLWINWQDAVTLAVCFLIGCTLGGLFS